MTTKKVLQEIDDERLRQDVKWGEQNHSDLYWLGILVEEVGELSRRIIERKCDDLLRERKCDDLLREELVQCAAVAVAWLECLDRRA